MKITELENKRNALEQEIAELNSQIENEKKKFDRWRADEKGIYYYISEDGIIIYCYDFRDHFDTARYDNYNYFSTRGIARVQLAYRKLDSEIKRFEVNHKEGWVITKNERSGNFSITLTTDYISPLPKLSNQEDAKFILKNFREDLEIFLKGGMV